MTLTASSLTDAQACPRRALLAADWQPVRWKPKGLFDACLRTGILAIAGGTDPGAAADEVKSRYLQAAANPGLELPHGANPYVIARDWCAMLDTLLRAAGMMGLAGMTEHPVVEIGRGVEHKWQPQAFVSGDGANANANANANAMLHRFVTLDRFAEADLRRETRSWAIAGDIAATGLPLTLHAIEIGQTRGGRRASPWARIFRNPKMNGLHLRFAKADGSALRDWDPVWLADAPQMDPDEWVERMMNEGVAQRLVHRVVVAPPDAETRERTVAEMRMEATRIARMVAERGGAGWQDYPMSRGACEVLGVECRFSDICYAAAPTANLVEIESLGVYKRNAGDIVTVK